MDQATREGRPAVSAVGHETTGEPTSPEELRAEIEQTRVQLGDTVQALAEKTDVKAQTKNRIAAVKDTAQHKKSEFVLKAKQATPDSAGAGARHVASRIQGKPGPFIAGAAFVAGLLVGRRLRRR